MAKQVLKVTDFTGGVNSLSDARDIGDTQFAQNWNAALDKTGIVRYSGGGLVNQYILPHDNTNKVNGFGLFRFSTDYSFNILDSDLNVGIEIGTIDAFTDTENFTLEATDTVNTDTVNYYANMSILIYSGTGAGETRNIISYNQTTRAIVCDAFTEADTNSKYKIIPWGVGADGAFGNAADLDWITDGSTSGFPAAVESPNGEDSGDNYFLSKTAGTIGDESHATLGYIEYKNSLTLKAGINYTLSFDCRAARKWFNYVSNGESDGSVIKSDQAPWVYLTSSNANLGLYSDRERATFIDISGQPTYDALQSNYVDNGDFASAHVDTTINVDGAVSAVTTSVNVNVSDTDATTSNSLNKIFFDAAGGNYIGNCTAVTDTTTIVFGGGISHSLVNDDDLFTLVGWNEIDANGYLTVGIDGGSTSYGAQDGTGILTSIEGFTFDGSPSSYIYSDNMSLVEETPHHLNFVYASTDGIAYSVYDATNSADIIPWTILPPTDSASTYNYAHERADETSNIGKKQAQYISFTSTINTGSAGVNTQVRFAPIKAGSVARVAGVTLMKAVCDLNIMSFNGSGACPFLDNAIVDWNTYSIKFKLNEDYYATERDDWVFRIYGGLATHRASATNSADTQTVYIGNIRLVAEEVDTITLLNDNTTSASYITMRSDSSFNWDTKFIKWPGLSSQPSYDYINGTLKISDGNFNNENANLLMYRYDRKFLNSYFDSSWIVTQQSLPNAPNIVITATTEDGLLGTKYDCISYINTLYSGLEYKNANRTDPDKYLYDEGSGKVVQRGVNNASGGFWQDGFWTNWDMDEIDKGILIRYGYDNERGGMLSDNDQLRPDGGTLGGQKGYKESQNIELSELVSRVDSDEGAHTYHPNSQRHAMNRGIRTHSSWSVDGIATGGHNPISFWICGIDPQNPSIDMNSVVGADKKISSINFTFIHEFQSSKWANSGNDEVVEDLVPYFEIKVYKINDEIKPGGAAAVAYNNETSLQDIKYEQLAADTLSDNFIDGADELKHIYIGKGDHDAGRMFVSSDLQELDIVDYQIPVEGTDGIIKIGMRVEGQLTFTGADNITSNDSLYITIKEYYGSYYSKCFSRGMDDVYHYTGTSHGLPAFDYGDWATNVARYTKIKMQKLDIEFYGDSYDEDTSNQQEISDDLCQANFNFAAPTGVDAAGWGEGIFRIAGSSVNIFDEESGLNENRHEEIGASTSGTGTISLGYAPTITIHAANSLLRDKFKKKTKFYMKKADSDIWYLQFYIDHEKCLLHSTTSSKKVEGIINPNKDSMMWTLQREGMANFNEVDSYESQTGISQESAIVANNALLDCRYKTSVVANNRLYVGNIEQNGNIYGDRMIKSPINKYNILPSTNFIDVAVNDGDEITALEFYKDKLLQFKKRKVFVINTSGDYEFLEDTFDNIGVQRQCQVTKTPMGIAWANSSGCFLYDGQQVSNLIDGKLGTEAFQSQIEKNYWLINNSNIPAIGYIKSTKKLLVTRDVDNLTLTGAPSMWQFDFVSQGWVFLSRKQKIQFSGATISQSNFINDENGDILYYAKESGEFGLIYKWNDSPVTNTHASAVFDNFYFITKDFDFGNPAVRKKIYKVYVTFKSYDDSNGGVAFASASAAHSNIKVQYATDGNLNSWTEFSTNSKNYDTTNGLSDGASSKEWITAELKPSSSINNVYSFALRFIGASTNIPNRFEINDFSIIYRIKRPK